MAPEVNIVVFYYSPYGEFIYDAVKFKNQDVLRNKVYCIDILFILFHGVVLKLTILWQQVEIKIEQEGAIGKDRVIMAPGDDFKIKFKMLPDSDITSTLHILSVDKRVHLLDNYRTNEISVEELLKRSHQVIQIGPVDYDSSVKAQIDSRYDRLRKFNAFFITNAFVKEKEIQCEDVSKFKIDHRFVSSEEIDQDKSENEIVPTPPASERPDNIRVKFPEIFLFQNVLGSKIIDNQFTISTKAPHSITSFAINAFSFHPKHGLGVSNEASFTVMQKLFVKLYLPYSIHVGETLRVVAVVHNYIKDKHEVNAEIVIEEVLEGDGEFEFVNLVPDGGTCKVEKDPNKKHLKKFLKIKRGTGESAEYFIRATKAGIVKIKVNVSAKGVDDTIIKELKIEHAGIRESINSAYLVDLTAKNRDSYEFQCPIGGYEKNSLHVTATAYGNLMGQVLVNTDNLIQMPGGEYSLYKSIKLFLI